MERPRPIRVRVRALVAALAALGCGEGSDGLSGRLGALAPDEPPPAPAIAPELPDPAAIDRDGDRVEDALETAVQTLADGAAPARVEVLFSSPVTADQMAEFVRAGGRIRHAYQAVAYGWSGTLPRSAAVA